MARIAISAALLLSTITATSAHADDSADIPDEIVQAATDAGVPAPELLGALNTLHASGYPDLTPHQYLRSENPGDSPQLPPASAAVAGPGAYSARVQCIIAHESRGNPNAVNRSSGASGLGQFLSSTWRTTPQGRAGYSVFDPTANRSAVAYMVAAGRAREFAVVTAGLC